MKKLTTFLTVVALVGCTSTISDRLEEGPYITLQTDKTPLTYSNCLKTTWLQWSPPEILDIEGGKRIVVAGLHVEQMVDVIQKGEGSEVTAYFRRTWVPGTSKLEADIRNCL